MKPPVHQRGGNRQDLNLPNDPNPALAEIDAQIATWEEELAAEMAKPPESRIRVGPNQRLYFLQLRRRLRVVKRARRQLATPPA